jgi:SAM-dependent methyltransferase
MTDTRWTAAKDRRGRSFGAVAADYAAWRPSYPADTVAFLVDGDRPRRVLDLGAGTGQLTAPLVAAGHDVVAADTSAGMLGQLSARLPGVPTFVAGAEELPLPDADVDVVVAAQAAHWFDPVRAAAEFRRVLRPGGAIGFTWHDRDDRTAWSRTLTTLLDPDARDQQGDGPESNRAVAERFAAELGAEVTAHRTRWVHRVPPEAVIGRAASSSRIALLDDAGREEHLGRIRELLATHPETRDRDELDVTYLTSSWRLVPR